MNPGAHHIKAQIRIGKGIEARGKQVKYYSLRRWNVLVSP